MARITVEGCLEHVENRFELVLAATQRARQLMNGFEATVPLDNHKPAVISLREIEAGTVDPKRLDEMERAREQASQAAEVGVSDEFIAGTTSSTTRIPISSTPASLEKTQDIVTIAKTVSSEESEPPRYTLRSEPSLFEQVANGTAPVEVSEPNQDTTPVDAGSNNEQPIDPTVDDSIVFTKKDDE